MAGDGREGNTAMAEMLADARKARARQIVNPFA
jgi:hypothetical protein